MADQAPLSDRDRADLIAYLDGELDERRSRELEARLGRDPKARAEAEALRRTWALLDYLPRPEPSEQFTHRTLSRLSALHPRPIGPLLRPHWVPWALGLGWVAALLLAGLAGYGATRLLPRRAPPSTTLSPAPEPERRPEPVPVHDPEEEWLSRAVREELAKKKPAERQAELHRLRQQGQQQQEDWLIAFRNWDELVQDRSVAHFTQPGFLDRFVKDYVECLLSKDEIDSLHRAEGKWPEYPRRLVALMDRHPFLLLGRRGGPTKFEDLPADVQKVLDKANLKERLRPAEGSWPAYAIMVTEVAQRTGVELPRPLGPCRLPRMQGPPHPPSENLPRPIPQFIRQELLKRPGSPLREEERRRLLAAEGRWPDFPRLVTRLAADHGVSLPAAPAHAVIQLPGPQAYWDRYRVRTLPPPESAVEVPAQTLVEFALLDLSPKMRAMFQVSFGDPQGYERLKQAYWKAHGGKK